MPEKIEINIHGNMQGVLNTGQIEGSLSHIAATTNKLAPLVQAKPSASETWVRPQVENKSLYFFDRDELVTEVNRRLLDSKFMVLAIRDKERDDYNSVSKRLLFEASEHQLHCDEQLWPVDFAALAREECLDKALIQAAENHFFSSGFPGDASPLTWHGVIEHFARQNFFGRTSNIPEARLVIELDFPEGNIKCPALDSLLLLIKGMIKLRKYLSDSKCKCTVFVVVYMVACRSGNSFFSKFSLNSRGKINFQTLCEFLSDNSGRTPFQFIASTLTELEEKDIKELDAAVARKLNLPSALLQQLSCIAKAHLRENGKASYSQLMNHIVTHDIYDALADVSGY